MQYPVIVEHINGAYRALIPALSGLSAEGATREEAVQNVRRAAEAYLSTVEVTTIEVALPVNQRSQQTLRPGSPQSALRAQGSLRVTRKRCCNTLRKSTPKDAANVKK